MLALLEALKRMLLVKASGGGEKTMHCLPQMMGANNKLGLDLDTASLHPYAILFVTITTTKDHTNLARPC